MNIKHTLLACALMALAGCASDSKWPRDGGTSSTSNTGSPATSSTSSTNSTSSMASTAGASSSPGMQSPGMQSSGSGVVQAIDQITRQDAMTMGLASGAAAAGGTMGSPMDKVYRITVRMDDGTTQTVMAESMPSYKNGDRVRYANGVVTRE